MAEQQIRRLVNRFGTDPELAFEQSGPLTGFDPDGVGPEGYESERGLALYRAIGASVDDEEYQLGTVATGFWAVVGLTTEGARFAVEEIDE